MNTSPQLSAIKLESMESLVVKSRQMLLYAAPGCGSKTSFGCDIRDHQQKLAKSLIENFCKKYKIKSLRAVDKKIVFLKNKNNSFVFKYKKNSSYNVNTVVVYNFSYGFKTISSTHDQCTSEIMTAMSHFHLRSLDNDYRFYSQLNLSLAHEAYICLKFNIHPSDLSNLQHHLRHFGTFNYEMDYQAFQDILEHYQPNCAKMRFYNMSVLKLLNFDYTKVTNENNSL